MLFRKGVNFNDYPAFFKRGTFVRRSTVERAFTAEELARIPEQHRPNPGATVSRTRTITLDMPVFSKVTNREAVIFDGAAPMTAP
jgi:tRNA(His) 5'-end guanylyltransferase